MWYSYLKENVKKNLKYTYLATFLINLWSERETFYFCWWGRMWEYCVCIQKGSRKSRRSIIGHCPSPWGWDWGTTIWVRFCHGWQKPPKHCGLRKVGILFPCPINVQSRHCRLFLSYSPCHDPGHSPRWHQVPARKWDGRKKEGREEGKRPTHDISKEVSRESSLTSHWPKLNHMTIRSSKGVWEMQSYAWRNTI